MELDLKIEMDPIPKARMTRFGKKSQRASRTLSYQKALAWEIKKQVLKLRSQGAKFNSLPDSLPLTPGSCFYELSATFSVTHNRRSDLDNYLKALNDALKWSGLIEDDSRIVSYGTCKLIRLAPAGSVKIVLRSINPETGSVANKSDAI